MEFIIGTIYGMIVMLTFIGFIQWLKHNRTIDKIKGDRRKGGGALPD